MALALRDPASLPHRPVAKQLPATVPEAQVVAHLLASANVSVLLGAGLVETALTSVLIVATIAAGGLYRPQLGLSTIADAAPLFGRSVAAAMVAAVVVAIVGGSAPALLAISGRSVLVGLAIVLAHAVVNGIARYVRRTRRVAHPALVVGSGADAERVMDRLAQHPEFGLVPYGPWQPPTGDPRSISGVLAESEPTVVVFASAGIAADDLTEMIRACDRSPAEVFVLPHSSEVLDLRSTEFDRAWDLPLIRLRRQAHRTPSWRLKRITDLVLGSLTAVVVAPVAALAAAAVAIENGRPLLFRQQRIGMDGRTFEILKFRTMPGTVDRSTAWNTQDDVRISPLSRMLRRLSLDELPQLWNVLRGDMSLVGPRPERPAFVDEFSETFRAYPDRHRVPSGITGLAQIHGLRGDTSIADRAHFDNLYIDSWSLKNDLVILARTPLALIHHRGS
ncbi:MAG: exopolysaccharide biosynthesis polyprenyl glycosylphosphotransferase [Actinomycetota bacterium]